MTIKAGNPLRAAGTARHVIARHGPNGLNGKQLRVIHYERPARQSTARHVMGYSQLLSIKTIRAVPCRAVTCRAEPSRAVPAARNGFPALFTVHENLLGAPKEVFTSKNTQLKKCRLKASLSPFCKSTLCFDNRNVFLFHSN